MAVKIGINGFGRIGKCVMRAALNNPDVEVVAINDTGDIEGSALLFKHDSIHGNLSCDVSVEGEYLVVDGKKTRVFCDRDPAKLDWSSEGVEVVIECTGVFRSREKAAAHLGGTVKKVIISAPGKDEDKTIVMGVNESEYDPATHHVVSNASCTTNCLAPFAKVLHQEFGIKRGMMTTVHSYTNDQRVLDAPHKDLRRARAAAMSIIPTPNVSVTDLVVELEKEATKESINAVFRKAAEGELKGILGVSDLPLVSKDFNGDARSSIVDADLTMVMEGNMAKVVAWYDNEWGYSSRIVDLAVYMSKRGL